MEGGGEGKPPSQHNYILDLMKSTDTQPTSCGMFCMKEKPIFIAHSYISFCSLTGAQYTDQKPKEWCLQATC